MPRFAQSEADEQVYYFGAAGGGVWRTQDGGQSWENIPSPADDYLEKRLSMDEHLIKIHQLYFL